MNIKVHVPHIVYTVRNGLHRDLVLRVTKRFWGKRKKWSSLPCVTACISKILNLESPFCGSWLQSADSVVPISMMPSRTIEGLSLSFYLAMMKISMWPSVILKATPHLTHRFYILILFFSYTYLVDLYEFV